jgi:hypothetical protein
MIQRGSFAFINVKILTARVSAIASSRATKINALETAGSTTTPVPVDAIRF